MKEILYRSTRGAAAPVTASQAILQGLAGDGGLFVPAELPRFDRSLEEFAAMDYQETAYQVMKLFLTDYTEAELRSCIAGAYDSRFDTPEIAPLAEADGAYYLELFHGRTIAFKDMALSILPHLMITAAKKNHDGREIVILTATSGDTGKAALEGFADVPGTKILVFYPKDGVSAIQKRQMITQKGDNTCVVGIEGNFDDAQTSVKKMFTDPVLRVALEKNGYHFSSANSINIGRLVPQIVYYVHAYSTLLREGRIRAGEEINVVVPTGNFGNILAAYYAKRLGLPLHRLICASNENKVLFDFFRTGSYDRNRPFVLTSSPSMDILISSNLERLIYHIAGDDAKVNAALMRELSEKGSYSITESMQGKLEEFWGGYAGERETAEAISSLYEKTGYVIDPHTAVARHVYGLYTAETGDPRPAVIAATASPFKFESSVMRALGQPEAQTDLDMADALAALANVPVPEAVESLRDAEVRHTAVCSRDRMEAGLRRFLGL
ncbi:threonine synthase [Lachnoclostridium sp. Marseille-P6806]|uniref:threonine synthase n=1 Tax=Lachnoclostridium sp. Marseille-P6806 TaxID=2364793 RepID=UPI00103217C3|nr:threonine synthase [Lachnoclostridium sp. Marseille-P6806]